jgi:hypothetical protein
MDKLAVSSANAQEIIGQGLINSLKILSEDSSVTDLATGMEEFATAISESIQGLAILIAHIKSVGKLPFGGAGAIFDIDKLFKFTAIPYLRGIFEYANRGSANDPAAGLAHLAELEAKYTAATLKTSKKLTAEELKQLKAKQLKAAVDKANLALGKAGEVFDVERIGLQAAELNQAAQLSKVTNQAQLLQITNDLARLQVKQSILDLDKAIESQDVAAITAATNKLNADLKVLGVLTNQKIQLKDIETILKGILPKDLINLDNLNAALALIGKINGSLGGGGSMASHAAPILGDPNVSPAGYPTSAATDALLKAGTFPSIVGGGGYSTSAGAYASSGFPGSDMGYGGNVTYVDITVNAGFGTDPEELARVVENVFNQSTDRGTSTNRNTGLYIS